MKRTILWIIAILALIAIIIWIRPRDKNALKPTLAAKKAIPVEAIVVRLAQATDIIRVSGNIISNEEVNLQSQIAGVVTEVHFEEGAHAHKNDLLIKIDDSPYQAQLQKDEASKQLDQITLERTKKLLAINGVAQQDFDVAQSNLKNINADMELIQVSIGYCSIRAPFDGIIGLKNISVGSYINTGTVIADFEQVNPVKVDFFVPEKYSELLKTGDTIHFTISGNEKDFVAYIYAFDPKIDQVSGGLHIRALARNNEGYLMPGQFASISLPLSHESKIIMAPSEAIISKVIGQDVYLDKSGIAALAPVELGIRTDSSVEITKGINAGDTLIVRGSMMIYPGTKVSVGKLR